MAQVNTVTVKPNVPAPDTFSGQPHLVREWLFGVELYFAACRLDAAGADAKYCAQLTASLLRGNALQWYRLACTRTPDTVPETYAALK